MLRTIHAWEPLVFDPTAVEAVSLNALMRRGLVTASDHGYETTAKARRLLRPLAGGATLPTVTEAFSASDRSGPAAGTDDGDSAIPVGATPDTAPPLRLVQDHNEALARDASKRAREGQEEPMLDELWLEVTAARMAGELP